MYSVRSDSFSIGYILFRTMVFEMVFSSDFRFGNKRLAFILHFSVKNFSNIWAFGLAMVGLAFLSASLNGS